MDRTKTGGPAFPVNTEMKNGGFEPSSGLTILDHFAGLIYPEVYKQYAKQADDAHKWDADWRRYLAADSYAMAAAMIAERERIMNAE